MAQSIYFDFNAIPLLLRMPPCLVSRIIDVRIFYDLFFFLDARENVLFTAAINLHFRDRAVSSGRDVISMSIISYVWVPFWFPPSSPTSFFHVRANLVLIISGYPLIERRVRRPIAGITGLNNSEKWTVKVDGFIWLHNPRHLDLSSKSGSFSCWTADSISFSHILNIAKILIYTTISELQ